MPAAAGKMRIWRITNDLPALRIGSRDYRLTGQHTERPGTLPHTFFSGRDTTSSLKISPRPRPTEAFTRTGTRPATCRQVHALLRREHAHRRYLHVLPVERGCLGQQEEANSHELFARMLEANGMKLVLGVEYACDENTLPGQRASQSEVAAGEPTLYSVSKEGKLTKNWCNTADTLLPEVANSFLTKIPRIGQARTAKRPGSPGSTFQVEHGWGPAVTYQVVATSDPLDWGYGDGIVRMFEKDTGLRVPGGPTDPKRFSIRYEWLMAHAREKWVAWRNRKVHDLNEAAAAIVRRANPAWKSFLFGNINIWHDADAALPPGERLRDDSYDPALYAGDPTIRFGVNHFRAHPGLQPDPRRLAKTPS